MVTSWLSRREPCARVKMPANVKNSIGKYFDLRGGSGRNRTPVQGHLNSPNGIAFVIGETDGARPAGNLRGHFKHQQIRSSIQSNVRNRVLVLIIRPRYGRFVDALSIQVN